MHYLLHNAGLRAIYLLGLTLTYLFEIFRPYKNEGNELEKSSFEIANSGNSDQTAHSGAG